MLAAAAPFQLLASSSDSAIADRALITQGDAFILAANKGEHGINFVGGDGSLGLQNGDVGKSL